MKYLLVTLLAACTASSAPPQHIATPTEPAPTAPLPAAEPAPSIYDLPVTLVAAHGRRIGIDVQRGKPVVVAMFYASCSIACPLLISEVAQLVAELPAGSDTEVLLISFDAARDTPEKLAALARERKLDARWTLATATDADARALAAVLGIRYRQLASGEFAHGSTIVALDPEGRPIGRTDALGHREPVLTAIARLRQ